MSNPNFCLQDTPPEPAKLDRSAAPAQEDAAQVAAAASGLTLSAAAAEQAEPSVSGKGNTPAATIEATTAAEENEQPPSGRGRGNRGKRGGYAGRGRGRGKARGRSKASGNLSPKAPSEDQADFANELESPSRNDIGAPEYSSQPGQLTDHASDSMVSVGDQQQANQAAKGSSQLWKAQTDASQSSGPHLNLKSQVLNTDDAGAEESKASKSEEAKASKAKEAKGNQPRASREEEPAAKRPKRAAAASTAQKANKQSKAGRANKPHGKATQARRGVVQESDTEPSDINIVGECETHRPQNAVCILQAIALVSCTCLSQYHNAESTYLCRVECGSTA